MTQSALMFDFYWVIWTSANQVCMAPRKKVWLYESLAKPNWLLTINVAKPS